MYHNKSQQLTRQVSLRGLSAEVSRISLPPSTNRSVVGMSVVIFSHTRPVDRKRARQLQHKKREDISGRELPLSHPSLSLSSPTSFLLPPSLPFPDLEENTKFLSGESRNDHQKHSPHPSAAKRRRKQSKDSESKPSEVKKTKKEKMESRKGYRKPGGKTTLTVQGGGKMGSIQSLLNAATLLEGEVEGGKGGGAGGGGGWREIGRAHV